MSSTTKKSKKAQVEEVIEEQSEDHQEPEAIANEGSKEEVIEEDSEEIDDPEAESEAESEDQAVKDLKDSIFAKRKVKKSNKWVESILTDFGYYAEKLENGDVVDKTERMGVCKGILCEKSGNLRLSNFYVASDKAAEEAANEKKTLEEQLPKLKVLTSTLKLKYDANNIVLDALTDELRANPAIAIALEAHSKMSLEIETLTAQINGDQTRLNEITKSNARIKKPRIQVFKEAANSVGMKNGIKEFVAQAKLSVLHPKKQ